MLFCYPDAASGTQGVHHRVNHIIGMNRNGTLMFHPSYLARLPVFPKNQPGNYVLEMAGIYEVVSEFYEIQRTEEGCYEVPVKRTYAYYVYDGAEKLRELVPDAVPDALSAVPFSRMVEHLDGMSGTCRYEV